MAVQLKSGKVYLAQKPSEGDSLLKAFIDEQYFDEEVVKKKNGFNEHVVNKKNDVVVETNTCGIENLELVLRKFLWLVRILILIIMILRDSNHDICL